MAITAPPAFVGSDRKVGARPRSSARMTAGVSVGYGRERVVTSSRRTGLERAESSRRGARRAERKSRNGLRYSTAAAIGFVAAFFVLFLPGMDAQAGKVVSETQVESVVTVQPGDSLWSVASRALPDMDPRSGIDALQEANGLSGTSLVPGQQLVVPRT